VKVLIVYPRMNFLGGGELIVVRLANYLSKQGIDITVLTTSAVSEIQQELNGTEIWVRHKVGAGVVGEFTSLGAALLEHSGKFDIINIHNFPAEVASVFVRKKPIVWQCNEPELYLYSQEKPYLVLPFKISKEIVRRRITKAIVSDRHNAKRFEGLYGFEPVVMPYGIDYDYFAVDSERLAEYKEEAREFKRHFQILQVGMVTPLKNQTATLRALRELKDWGIRAGVVFAGWIDWRYKKELDGYIAQHRLENSTLFLEQIDRGMLRSLYYTSDILLHPIKDQGGWLSPFEAMCCKLPVVTSVEFTASDIIMENKLGYVVNDYVDAILDIKAHPISDEELERRRAWVKDNLSWDRYCEGMLGIFKELVNV